MRFKELYSDKDVLKWHEEYEKLQSAKKVGEKFGVTGPTVSKRLKAAGFHVNGNKKIYFDEDFFENDSPDSFYWAGFLAADGCVSQNKHGNIVYISVTLAKKDSSHIRKLKKCLKYNGSGKTNSFCVYSKKICSDLKKFNIVPRKSLVYTFPIWLADHPLVNHFMRGYFDGDGSFYLLKTKEGHRKKLGCCVCGTYDFLKMYRNILSSNCHTNPNIKIRPVKSIYQLEYCGNNNIIKICDFLYKNSNDSIYMDRKFKIINEKWITDDRKYQSRFKKVMGTSIIDNSFFIFDAICDAEQLGFVSSGISSCLTGRQKTHKNYTWKYLTK